MSSRTHHSMMDDGQPVLSPTVETLAHITAPSGARDDATYRAHAAACLDFQPVSRLRLQGYPSGDGDNEGETDVDARISSVPEEKDSQKTTSTSFSRSANADLSGSNLFPAAAAAPPSSSPIQISLLTSSEDEEENQHERPDNKPLAATVVQNDQDADVQSSLESLPSTVPDSQPLVADDETATTGGIPPSTRNNGRIRFARELVRDGTRPPDHNHDNNTNHNNNHYEDLDQQQQPAPKKPRLASAAPARDADRVQLCMPQRTSPSADGNPNRDKNGNDEAGALLTNLPLQILPAPPLPSSTAEFTTHITPKLRILAARLQLERVFRPRTCTRTPRNLERGCWVLKVRVRRGENALSAAAYACEGDADIWPSPFFAQFWSYLATVIGTRGHAGWGVWCHCDVDTSTAHVDDKKRDKCADIDTLVPLTLRIYTWGETAPHVYLLLCLASEKRVKRLPVVEWRDGSDEAVIQMH